jgi:Cdc6-like AAA superfamily ATPase
MSDIASKRSRVESEASGLQELATIARERRKHIRQFIEELESPVVPSSQDASSSKDVTASKCPDIVSQLSDPTFKSRLPFPFVGETIPNRFDVDNNTKERSWLYVGREKLAYLLSKFEHIRHISGWKALYVYGTRGYGKSHLLAAMVCVLAATETKVVYIPDCREFIQEPIRYMITAMLFAWVDDESKQRDIMALKTQEDIYAFFQGKKDVVFVIDQLNALQKQEQNDKFADEKLQLYKWLINLKASHKAILSSSANNHTFLEEATKQSSTVMMYTYGGLTEVSLRSNSSFVK